MQQTRAVFHAQRLIARSGALHVSDRSGFFAIRWTQHVPIRPGRCEQPFDGQTIDDVGKATRAVFLFGRFRGDFIAGGQNDRLCLNPDQLLRLRKVDRGDGAGLLAFATQQ
jgi:hypothetical protein